MTTEVTDSKDKSRYEITVDGDLAGFAEYRDMKGTRVFTHTEVFSAFGGRGLGSILVRSALDDVRDRDGTLVALCPFVDRFVREHAEYGDLVDADLDVRLRD